MTAEIAYLRIHKAEPNGFIGFRDAAMGPATYRLHLHNVLRSIEKVFIRAHKFSVTVLGLLINYWSKVLSGLTDLWGREI